MTVKIDSIERSEILYGVELTETERKEFDYYDADDLDSAMFARHDGVPYDLGEFTSVPDDVPGFNGWYAMKGEGFFMGKVIRYHDDDTIDIGAYYC